jgi:TonB family protein
MKERSLHRLISVKVGALLTLLVLALAFVPLRRSAAQIPQRDRQLKREPSQPTSPNDRRLALVIGNGSYQNASRLTNPPNDAEDMATALRDLSFELVGGQAYVNQTGEQTKQLIVKFGEVLSRQGGVGLFYYAGHGVQSQGHNYLIPIEAKVLHEKTLEFDAVDVNRVLAEMDASGNGFNIVILDACRNNPFARSWRDAGQGLAQVNAPEGTLIAYATGPGRVANDGDSRNGTYTAELLRQMRVKDLTIEEMFKAVRAKVRSATSNQQTPWEASSLVGKFCLAGTCKEPTAPNIPDPDVEFWNSIKSSNDPDDYRAYKKIFPNGRYIATADNNLRRLGSTKTGSDNGPAKAVVSSTGNEATNTTVTAKAPAVVKSSERDRGIGYYKENRIPEAVQALQKAVKENGSDYQAWNFLGLALTQKQDLKSATTSFETALRLNGSSAPFHTNLSWVLLLRNKMAEAEREALAALAIDAGIPEAHYIIGVIRLRAGGKQDALDRAETAIKLNPEFGYAYLLKSQALVNFIGDSLAAEKIAERYPNRYSEAAAALETFLRLGPKTEDTQTWREQLESLRFYMNLPNDHQGDVVFSGNDVTTKAVVLNKPEAQYTKAADSDGITGTVILRVIFAADGIVKYPLVISGLPSGLTEQALKAARRIKFTPATSSGRAVAVQVQVEYYFYLPRLIPNPELAFAASEDFQANGKAWTRYKLTVANLAAYPNALFAASPSLPPCGSNTKSARTWVDIYDRTGKRLNGFCALISSLDLNKIWFAVPQGDTPPSHVYVVLTDRLTNATYKSNLVAIP